MSLSTATPSLGGVSPKLATLKLGYEVPHFDYDGMSSLNESSRMYKAFAAPAKKSSGFMRIRALSSLAPSSYEEADEPQSLNTVNVLAARTEASMSSASFAIPRRSTIDADVSLFSFCYLSNLFFENLLFNRASRIK